jgi:hypothetical protein
MLSAVSITFISQRPNLDHVEFAVALHDGAKNRHSSFILPDPIMTPLALIDFIRRTADLSAGFCSENN